MSMIYSFISERSLAYYLEIIVSFWIFINHTSVKSVHQFLILFWAMITCSVFPHHISNSGSFSYSEMFYMFVYFFISCFYLSYNRQNVNGLEVNDFHRLIILCNWRDGRNDNCHSCQEEGFKDGLPAVLAAVGWMILSSLHTLSAFLWVSAARI